MCYHLTSDFGVYPLSSSSLLSSMTLMWTSSRLVLTETGPSPQTASSSAPYSPMPLTLFVKSPPSVMVTWGHLSRVYARRRGRAPRACSRAAPPRNAALPSLLRLCATAASLWHLCPPAPHSVRPCLLSPSSPVRPCCLAQTHHFWQARLWNRQRQISWTRCGCRCPRASSCGVAI